MKRGDNRTMVNIPDLVEIIQVFNVSRVFITDSRDAVWRQIGRGPSLKYNIGNKNTLSTLKVSDTSGWQYIIVK
jgi:hypothetical protein